MPTCELVTIGSELLNGAVLNTNAQFLARELSRLDFEVVHQASCRDREEEMVDTLAAACRRSDLIIATGGLGPTPDDITRQAVARLFRCGLRFDPGQYRLIVAHFRKLSRTTPFMTRREAFLPEVAKPLLNRFGIALGFYVYRGGKLLIVLPGVPMELVRMFDESVQSLICRVFRKRSKRYGVEAQIAGLYETQIMRKLGGSFFKGRVFDFGIYPEVGQVTVRIKAQNKALISTLRRELAKKLKPYIYSFQGQTLSQVIGEMLRRRAKTLSVAESCTGGLLAARVTDSSGASRYYKGGVVAYSNEAKRRYLNISSKLLSTRGAVSPETARAMASGVRHQFRTSIGVAVTGIAGPTGGSRTKPVGLVYIAISDDRRTRVFQWRFLGDREKVRLQATQKALFCLWQWLL